MIYYIYPCLLGADFTFIRIDRLISKWRGEDDFLIPMDDIGGTRHFFLNYNSDNECLCCEENNLIWKTFSAD